jgi:hypothetical protein
MYMYGWTRFEPVNSAFRFLKIVHTLNLSAAWIGVVHPCRKETKMRQNLLELKYVLMIILILSQSKESSPCFHQIDINVDRFDHCQKQETAPRKPTTNIQRFRCNSLGLHAEYGLAERSSEIQ